MIVRQVDMERVVARLMVAPRLSLDTETTGLYAYKEDQLFSLVIADGNGSCYFNFQTYPDLASDWCLPRASTFAALRPVFARDNLVWYLHNAKFDLAMLHREAVAIQGQVHCTLGLGRVLYNEYLGYSLRESVERIGLQKDEAVENYIEEMGLWQWRIIPGKKKRDKVKFFDQVPFQIISTYGEKDAAVTFALGEYQAKKLSEIATNTPGGLPSILSVVENEKTLTKTCFEIERVGIRIDRDYCLRAADYETQRYVRATEDFHRLTSIKFVDSGKVLSEAFTRLGESYPKTEKGNPSFTDDVLEKCTSPVAKLVQEYRDAYKRANTYYRNFLFYADRDDVIHANIRQGGTATGRFSYSDPNLQNLNKEEAADQPFLVRRAFVPRPGFFFAMLDYDQMEYRLMLDYAGENSVIAKVLAGLDVHEATAQMMGTTRTKAKMLNFLLLYGGGIVKLAWALGCSVDEARRLREEYFRALPNVRKLVREIMDAATHRGFIFNWLGRRSYFPDSKFAYKAPNYLIQGGCADVVKMAMNRLSAAAFKQARLQSRMLVQIHDEILFEIHESEAHILPTLKDIMESVYPAKHLPLTVGVEHSFTSWADKIEGYPNGAKA